MNRAQLYVSVGVLAVLALGNSDVSIGWDDEALAIITGEQPPAEDSPVLENSAYSQEDLNKIYKAITEGTEWDWRILKAIAIHETEEGALLNEEFTGDCVARNGKMPDDYKDKDGHRLCWGRGLFSLDHGSYKSWFKKNDWRDPMVNAKAALEHLEKDLAKAKKDSRVKEPKEAAIAAFNAGWGNVDKALDNKLPVEAYTTNKTVTINGEQRVIKYTQAVLLEYRELVGDDTATFD